MRNRDDSPQIQLRLRWSPNAFRGFVVSMGVMTIVLIVSMCTTVEPPEPYVVPKSRGTEVLLFGYGDGTGARKGNLQKEGKAQKGEQISDPLEDASRARPSSVNRQSGDPTESANLVAVKETGKTNASDDEQARGDETRGSRDGADDGTGRGWAGTGTGKGMGYGDIDWGGGGNRVVLNKVKPRFPPGTLDTKVQLRFRVRPNGTVSFVIPVRRGGNPRADAAAMQAMRQWRFNPLDSDKEMEGTITFVFKSS